MTSPEPRASASASTAEAAGGANPVGGLSRTPLSLWPSVAVVAISVLVVSGGAYFGWMLLTLPPGSDSDTKVLAAVLGFLGVLVTGTISLAGLVLKHSMDLHTLALQKQSAALARQAEERLKVESEHNVRLGDQAERRLQMEADHNRQLATQAEGRLQLETAIQAVGMLSTSGGATAPHGQKAGALFALASLNQLEFALTLLETLWAREEIDAVSAVWLVNRGLKAGGDLERTAVNILRDNRQKLHLGRGNFLWPETVSGPDWNPGLSLYSRELLLQMEFQIMLQLPYEEWDVGFLLSALIAFYTIATTDPNGGVKRGAVSGIDVLLGALALSEDEVIFNHNSSLPVSAIVAVRDELQGKDSDSPDDWPSDSLVELGKQLAIWAGLMPKPATAKLVATPLNPAAPAPDSIPTEALVDSPPTMRGDAAEVAVDQDNLA